MSDIWYFTFCGCHDQRDWCQPIEAESYGEARAKMFEMYGDKWGFQYSASEWENYKNDPRRWWPMEKELPLVRVRKGEEHE